MKCECGTILNDITKIIKDSDATIRIGWERGGSYARKEMDVTVIEIKNCIIKYKMLGKRCGCFDGVKLSRINDIIIPYEKNKQRAADNGGDYFKGLIQAGAYNDIIQNINDR